MKKKRKKWPIVLIIVGAVLLVLIAVGFVACRGLISDQLAAGLINVGGFESAEVVKDDIASSITASGELTDSETEIELPEGVTVSKTLIKKDEKVSAGELIAELDAASIAQAIANTKTALADVNKSLKNIAENKTKTVTIAAKTAGTVKTVFAKEGDEASELMAQNGAIMILTIDGDAEYKVKVDAGKIKRLNVGEGASVKSGTTLFTVDIPLTRGDKESYAAKQAALVERLEDLTELSVAAALYAPEAGTVSNVNIASGPEVPTGPAFTINPDDRIALKVDVNELDIANVQVGFEAEIEIDAIPNEVFAGKVADVSKKSQNPEEYGASGYSVVIELERTAGMMAGMSASVTIVKEKKSDVLVIPMDAVQEMDGRLFVYTEMGETGELTGEKDIKTGLSDGTTVEVTSGLAEGDTVHYYAIPDIDGGDGTTITMG